MSTSNSDVKGRLDNEPDGFFGDATAGAVTDAWFAQAVVTEAPEAIVVTDPDGIVRLWNNGAARVFGFIGGRHGGPEP